MYSLLLLFQLPLIVEELQLLVKGSVGRVGNWGVKQTGVFLDLLGHQFSLFVIHFVLGMHLPIIFRIQNIKGLSDHPLKIHILLVMT